MSPKRKNLKPVTHESIAMPLILIFILLPVLEILVFFEVADGIGWPKALLFTLLTSFYGLMLLRYGRYQLAALNRYCAERAGDKMPSLWDSVYLYFSGILLLLPGFITDVLGILLLIPWCRKGLGWLARYGLGHSATLRSHVPFGTFYYNMNDYCRPKNEGDYDPYGEQSETFSENTKPDQDDDIIDVEYEIKK